MNYGLSKNFYDTSKIPKDWKETKLKYILSISDHKSLNWDQEKILSLTQKGIIERDITTNEGQIAGSYKKYILVTQGEICMNPMDLLSGWVDISSYNGLISPAYYTFKLKKEFDNKFINYFLQSNYFRKTFFKIGKGVASHDNFGRWVLTPEELRNFTIFFPSISEQNLISDFLDTKTKKVELLVKKINKKVELLKEQQMSLIDQYVTKGHNSNAEMKDSGVEWIGEIPKHWELTKIKYLSKIENGSTPKSNIEKYWDGLIKWFTPTDFKNISEDGFLNKPSRFISEDGLKNSGCSYVEQDSILMTTRAPVGNIAKVKKGFTFNQGCKSITPNEVNIDYLYFYLSTKDKVLNALSNGTTFQELSTVRLLNFAINLPSKTEQTEIVTFLKKNTSKIKKMIELLNTKVDRTKEYHQSLISSVVTGKVRVTEDMV